MGRFKNRRGPKGLRRSIRFDAEEATDRPRPSGEPPPSIHLRQLFAEQAMAKLEQQVELHRRRGTQELLIVHGKGLRSEGGQPVIGPLVRAWCETHTELVKTWREAPRDWGGEGAIVVTLRGDE